MYHTAKNHQQISERLKSDTDNKMDIDEEGTTTMKNIGAACVVCLILVDARMVRELYQIGHKLLQAAGHVCLGFLSIRCAIWHLMMLFAAMPTKQDNRLVENPRAKLGPLHLFEILIQLNETGTHVVDAVLMICTGLSHGLKGALCLLASPIRSLQQILMSKLEAEDRERWEEEQKEAEEEKRRMKQCLPEAVSS